MRDDDDDEDELEEEISSMFRSQQHHSVPLSSPSHNLLRPHLPQVDPIDPSVLGVVGFNVEITPPPGKFNEVISIALPVQKCNIRNANSLRLCFWS